MVNNGLFSNFEFNNTLNLLNSSFFKNLTSFFRRRFRRFGRRKNNETDIGR